MTGRQLTSIDFYVDGEEVEYGIEHDSVPAVGERVEIGKRVDDDGDPLDPGISDVDDWWGADYETVLVGDVVGVTRHYHTAHSTTELTAKVELEVVDDAE